MVESWAEKLAIKIKQANPEQTASVPVMKFALIIVINFTVPVIAAMAFGISTGKGAETLTAVSYLLCLRMLSGGYHFERPLPCMLITFLIVAVPPHMDMAEQWTPILTGIALILVLLLAPANMKGYNTIPETYYPLLKIVSALIVCSNFLFFSETAAIVLAVQGFTLLFRNKEVKST
ncbi:MAG: post-translational modification of quorum-sensing peptide protein [Thermobacillus sp. ZCTH02-B1]|uniref:accessory gene regulator B family protein n=1 Tax=Thermobacillus sp. ZCTH02-B1 TaxID=1858795 RepID=UPI000B55DC28|nr:accessory gene regulator B family protein [Thermobacillus sp. ZCTH02-B1]OUM93855.1 MAG: post-translational modification of quorum-sensing peptide protein [Thermobacillus sp. ZCTH02-B1]